nr:hypothetical protein [Treponemataceae bacterium]
RQEILKNLAIPFTVMSPSYEEPFFPELSPIETAELHSMKKVESVIRMDLNQRSLGFRRRYPHLS